MLKSPMNYIGGKYKLLPQLLPLFPTPINTFVDLFCGGLDVSLNVSAQRYVCNDACTPLIDLYKAMQKLSFNEILEYFNQRIAKFKLSKENKDGYYALRQAYNQNKKPLDLFVLMAFSFSNQIRFNVKMEFNSGFGQRSFNPRMRDNLQDLMENIKKLEFLNLDFSEVKVPDDAFVYADPPYFFSKAAYNESGISWNPEKDAKLFEYLDGLNAKGIKFLLSNVSYHKGKTNESLLEFAKKYELVNLSRDYSNCWYNTKNDNKTQEVAIKNY